jgi:hypothetical protein
MRGLTSMLLALLTFLLSARFSVHAQTCPISASQFTPYFPATAPLQAACLNQPGSGCSESCLCALAVPLRQAFAANGLPSPNDKNVLQACLIDNLAPLTSAGLTISDLMRVSPCSFAPGSEPACLTAPLPAPSAAPPPAPPAPPSTLVPSSSGPTLLAAPTPFAAVLIATLGSAAILLVMVAALSLSEGASAAFAGSNEALQAMSRVDFSRLGCIRVRGLRGGCSPRIAEPILDGVSLSLLRGSLVGVIGPSGSGKSTLLHILAGELVLNQPSGSLHASGSVSVDGSPVTSRRTLAALRRRVGFVQQDGAPHQSLPIARSPAPQTTSSPRSPAASPSPSQPRCDCRPAPTWARPWRRCWGSWTCSAWRAPASAAQTRSAASPAASGGA